jgi:hypothetical protein
LAAVVVWDTCPRLRLLPRRIGFCGTFLPLPKLAIEPFLKLWEQEVFALLLAEGKITEEIVANIRSWKHSGFSVDQSVRLEGGDREGVKRLIQYFLRCPFSQARMTCLCVARRRVEVTEAGKVIYKTEHNAVGRFAGQCRQHCFHRGATALFWMVVVEGQGRRELKWHLLAGPQAVEQRDRCPERLKIEEVERVLKPVEEFRDRLRVDMRLARDRRLSLDRLVGRELEAVRDVPQADDHSLRQCIAPAP